MLMSGEALVQAVVPEFLTVTDTFLTSPAHQLEEPVLIEIHELEYDGVGEQLTKAANPA